MSSVRYDGCTDDLLTDGLGFAGLRDTTPPGFADPDNPTPAELRRRAVWSSAGLSAGDGGGLGRLCSSRPYLGLNSRAGQGHGTVSYVEVTHAHHADSTAPGYDNRYVPLGFYYQLALDLMWQRLRDGTPLPPSQVVRTTPRGGEPGRAPALAAANVPPVAATPAAGDRIRVSGGTVRIPDGK